MPLNLQGELRRHFHFDSFRPGQEVAVRAILDRRNILVVMPTGAGKSLCYQLPALLHSGTTVVVSPLIALMKDQVEALQAGGKAATFINSSISGSEQASRIQAMRAGQLRLVYVAPERFRSQAFLSAIAGLAVDLFVVDEAHCISHWGHDFRPDYMNLKNVIAHLNQPPVAALTATATVKVQNDIIQQLGLQNCERIVTGFNRPNLSFEVEYTPDDNSKRLLLEKLLKRKTDSTIIYTATRRETEEVAEFVKLICKAKADFYHAGLDASGRSRIQDSFMKNETTAIVATNAFGMGVDKPDVRSVIHYNLPGTLEAYYQEAGRAGRDGRPSRAILLYSPHDRSLQEWFIENSLPTPEELGRIYHVIQAAQNNGVVRINLDNLQKVTGFYETKVRVGIAELVKAQALMDLGDQNHMMNFTIAPIKKLNLSQNLREIQLRREYKYQQLNQIIGYAQAYSCRRRFILDHFGDTGSAEAERCCDNCLSQTPVSTSEHANASDFTAAEKIALIILHAVKHVPREVGRSRLVEILTGSTAKEIFEFGWHKTKPYGRLKEYTQAQCRDLIDQLLKTRYLTLAGSDYPVLQLTPKGTDALRQLARIPLGLATADTPAPVGSPLRQIAHLPPTVRQTLMLFRQGLSPELIAQRRNLTTGTIFGHLSQLVAFDLVQVTAIVPVEKVQKIRVVINEVGLTSLKPIKEHLPEDFNYDEIRCVVEDEVKRRRESPASILNGTSKLNTGENFHNLKMADAANNIPT